VQALMHDLENVTIIHKEEMQEAHNKNKALESENAELRSQIRRLMFKVDKLTVCDAPVMTPVAHMRAGMHIYVAPHRALHQHFRFHSLKFHHFARRHIVVVQFRADACLRLGLHVSRASVRMRHRSHMHGGVTLHKRRAGSTE
jgi:hypothetical protein